MYKKNLFGIMLFFSTFIHVSVYAAFYIVTNTEVDYESIREDIDVNLENNPSALQNKIANPPPIIKKDWIENEDGNKEDTAEEDINLNAISGNGSNKDGYILTQNVDKVPTPIIDFDLKQFFPTAAKAANITNKIVVVLVFIDEKGALQDAKVVSGEAGYGFDEAALKIIHLARYTPGYVKGKPVKMSHRIPIHFTLDDP